MENQVQNSKSQNSNTGLKVVIAILTLLLGGSLFYMYKISNDSKASELILTNEKTSLLNELKATSDSLNQAIDSNSTMSNELMLERDKIQELMANIENSKGDNLETLRKYKMEVQALKSKIAVLMKQVNHLETENKKLGNQIDSTNTVLAGTRQLNDTLTTQNDKLSKAVEKASKLTVLNLQARAVKQKGSGKIIDTDKANKANVLKISFMIAENQIAKSEDKEYYVQIIDNNNNVIGEKKLITFDDMTLTYSFKTNVKYENKTVKVEKDLLVENLTAGNYFINIFDQKQLVSKTSFMLK